MASYQHKKRISHYKLRKNLLNSSCNTDIEKQLYNRVFDFKVTTITSRAAVT